MSPNKAKTINHFKIEEFYWNGRFIVYVNNHKSDMTFEEALKFYGNKA